MLLTFEVFMVRFFPIMNQNHRNERRINSFNPINTRLKWYANLIISLVRDIKIPFVMENIDSKDLKIGRNTAFQSLTYVHVFVFARMILFD